MFLTTEPDPTIVGEDVASQTTVREFLPPPGTQRLHAGDLQRSDRLTLCDVRMGAPHDEHDSLANARSPVPVLGRSCPAYFTQRISSM
jgi:hypothetical protein